MNDNELINTAVTNFTPYQFDPQSVQVMPTGFDRTAVRAEKRISDTQKRVNDLVKLDPTNPLATVLTMMGANQTQGIRDDLMSLRGQAFGSDQQGKKRKKQLADIKAMGLDDALGVYARKNHAGDLDSALGDPDLLSGLEQIQTTPQSLDYKEQGKLLEQVYKVKTQLEMYEKLGADISKVDEKTKRHYENWLNHANRLLSGGAMSPMEYQNFSDDPLVKKAPSPTTTKKVIDNPDTIVDESQEAIATPVAPAESKRNQIRNNLTRKTQGEDAPKQTGVAGIYNDGKRWIQDNAIDPIGKSVLGPKGQVRKDLKGATTTGVNWLFGELPQELTDQGWVKEQMRLNPSKGKVKVGDQLPEMREVAYNNSTGVYVGERVGKTPYFVGDPVNGVQKSFKTEAEAFAWASTYRPKPTKVDRKLDSTIMDSIGTGASGSYGTDEPSENKGGDSFVQTPFMKQQMAKLRKSNPQKYAEIVAKLASQGKQFGSKGSQPMDVPKEYPKVVSQDARTQEEKNTKPWERSFVGGKVSGGIKKIKELNQHVLDNHKEYHPAWAYNNPRKSNDAVAQDVATLYLAGKKKVGEEGWDMVLDMVKTLGGVGGDALGWLITPSDVEGATLNESTQMGSGNNIYSGGSNLGGVGKAGKNDGGFAGRNPIAASVEQFRSNPFVEAMVTAESSGNERAIGYKLVEKQDSNGKTKLVHAKDSEGKKIPASYGLMQVTINTALSTKAGKELMKGLNPKVKEDREQIKNVLFDPYNNLKIATEFSDRLRVQLSKNKYASQFSPLEFDQLISAAYNYKGENFAKDVLDKVKPTSIKELLHKAYIPKETRRQIRVVGQTLRKAGV